MLIAGTPRRKTLLWGTSADEDARQWLCELHAPPPSMNVKDNEGLGEAFSQYCGGEAEV
jgi:hypothetical protein